MEAGKRREGLERVRTSSADNNASWLLGEQGNASDGGGDWKEPRFADRSFSDTNSKTLTPRTSTSSN